MMSSVPTVTVNPSFDSTATVSRVEADRKIRCSEVVEHPGGGGINVARAIDILGGRATALWAMGGFFGTGIRRLLEAQGVEHLTIEISGHNRQGFAVVEEGSGRHYRFSAPGPVVSDEELERLATMVQSRTYEILVLSGGLPPSVDPEFYAHLASIAAAKEARVVLDTHGEPLRATLADGNVYLVKPNYRELAEAVGVDLEEGDFDVVSASRDLIGRGWASVVVTSLGAAGVVLAPKRERFGSVLPRCRSAARLGLVTVPSGGSCSA